MRSHYQGMAEEPDKIPGLRNRIKELREARDLNQTQLGEKISVSHATIARLESGKIELTTEYMIALGRALGVHPLEIICDLNELPKGDDEIQALHIMREMDPDSLKDWMTLGKRLTKRR